MPNRILRESICSSESVQNLTLFEEVLFYRLIVNCDDYGRFDGRVNILRAKLFPLKENVSFKKITDGLRKLEQQGIVQLYEIDEKPYLCLVNWTKYQNVRNKKSKYPSPEEP